MSAWPCHGLFSSLTFLTKNWRKTQRARSPDVLQTGVAGAMDDRLKIYLDDPQRVGVMG